RDGRRGVDGELMTKQAREPALSGQTVVVIGGSARLGLEAGPAPPGRGARAGAETARAARAEGADVILTGRNADRLESAAADVGALRTSAFDAHDLSAIEAFFDDLDVVDHVMVTAGRPYYAPLTEMAFDEARRSLYEHPMVMLGVARHAGPKVRSGGTLVFMGGTGGRRTGVGMGIIAATTAALPALTANLAVEIA